MISYDRMFQHVFLARVDGQDVNDLIRRAGDITISEDTKRATQVTIDFEDYPDMRIAGAPSLMDDPRLKTGKVWEIRWGYLQQMSSPIIVRVAYFEPDYKENGTRTLKLTMLSKGARQASLNTQARNWGRVNSSEIARSIASSYGLRAEVEDSDDRRASSYHQPSNKSDMEYLQELARENDWVCYVDGGTLHYHAPRTGETPVTELTWYAGGTNPVLLSFKPSVKEPRATRNSRRGGQDENGQTEGNSPNAPTGSAQQTPWHGGSFRRVNVVNRNVSRTYTEGVPEHDRVRDGSSAQSSPIPNAPGRQPDPSTTSSPTPERSHNRRRRGAVADQNSALERANEAKASCIGLPYLRRDLCISIRGVAQDLSGTWYVKGTTHKLGKKYTTELDLSRRAPHASRRGSQDNNHDAPDSTTPGANTTQPGQPGRVVVVVPRRQIRVEGGNAPRQQRP